jgi:hypothetical protein
MDRIHAVLPPLLRIEELVLQPGDVFLGGVGFEDRKFAAINALRSSNGAEALVLIYKPGNPRDDVSGYIDALSKKGFAIGDNNRVEYNRFSPYLFAEVLQSRLSLLRATRVLLDISAMSKLAILLCLHVCKQLDLHVSVFYAEAQDYGPSQREYEDARASNALQRPSIQIYAGVQGVLRVPQFSSVAMQGQPTAAIAFMSFNEELIQALLDSVYPSRLFLVNSKPPKLGWREQATAWIHNRLVKEWSIHDNPIAHGLPTRSASTLDYREAFTVVRDLYWRLNVDHRILVAPTGSKMQALGCFLMVALHPDIHIEYPTPEGFLSLYSKGVGDGWLVELGSIRELLARLADIDSDEYLRVRTPTHDAQELTSA